MFRIAACYIDCVPCCPIDGWIALADGTTYAEVGPKVIIASFPSATTVLVRSNALQLKKVGRVNMGEGGIQEPLLASADKFKIWLQGLDRHVQC